MTYEQILIRYGEISTKGKNRLFFVNKLRENVQYVLQDFPGIAVRANRDRMFIHLNGNPWEPVAERLKKVFGIASFSPVLRVKKDLDAVLNEAVRIFRDLETDGKTFKVNAKRSDKTFAYTSDEMNQRLGAHLLEHFPGLKVDVRHPDYELLVEIRKNGIFLTCEKIRGAGGLPAASAGKAMLMLSGGIDSPVAAYMAMKRGLEVEAVHFFSPPYTSERARQKVIDLVKVLSLISGHMTLYVVPFTEIQQKILQTVPDQYRMTIMRRLMLRITDEIRKKFGGLAIITGESLGQVASQTLDSMYVINEVTSTPVIRPLVAMDKTDIIKIADEIGTLEISNRPYEDCCTIFTPAQPVTRPKLGRAKYYESKFNYEPLIETALREMETIRVEAGKTEMENSIENLF